MDPFNAKLIAAATGSMVTALTMTPFDVVKTRLQTQAPVPREPLFPNPPPDTCCQPAGQPCVNTSNNGKTTRMNTSRSLSSLARPVTQELGVCVWHDGTMQRERVTGFFDAARHVWRAEGIRGLWKGAGTSLAIGMPSATAYMLTYDHLLRVTLPPLLPASIVPLFAGVIARSSITAIVSPLELLRTNLQSTPVSAANPHTLRSVTTSLSRLVTSQGVHSLWRGLVPSLWRDVPFSGIYWATYEGLKKRMMRRGHEGATLAFFCGATSGMTAALLTSPFDVLKTRRQAIVMSETAPRGLSTVAVMSNIIRTEGTSALFAGLAPRMAKIAPACGIMIACFEGIGKALARPE
ncbi:mitochondrial carrier [Schizophyllum commune H4-8]|uniref:mitochondrial carrier n=1 Tax=Schizophyllum commune (strain H4-8 / FGSC 9210) TaxID=578458 RepID=UPI0021607EBD|nr:mitochondrial carrier [Schizophyllum commune H4-8]KAI5898106.1 mitochondrial carrier [Schizophyllum commune H4-8]